jgi:hypothetical protein
MPPQQSERPLDVFDDAFRFRAHTSFPEAANRKSGSGLTVLRLARNAALRGTLTGTAGAPKMPA